MMLKRAGGLEQAENGEVTILPTSQPLNQPARELTLLKSEESQFTNPPCLSGDLQVPAQAASRWKKSWT